MSIDENRELKRIIYSEPEEFGKELKKRKERDSVTL